MKILFLYGHDWGGSFVLTQAAILQRDGHHVAIICTGEGPFAQACRNRGIEVHVIPFQGSSIRALPRIARSMTDIVRHIRLFQPDVLHYHLIKAIIVGRLCGWIARVPRRYSQLGGPLTLEMRRFRWLDLMTSFIDTKVICPSIGVQALYRQHRLTRNKTALLYYGFDQSVFAAAGAAGSRAERRAALGLNENDPVVALVAYMYPTGFRRFRNIGLKGHETLIEAAVAVLDRHPRAQFLIVGADPGGGDVQINRLMQKVATVGLQSRFVFTGYRSDVSDIVALADIAVVPSLSENCGGAVEPFAAGIPVIASDTGGLPELVLPGITGFRFQPGNADDLARVLIDAFATPNEELRQLGRNGQRLVAELFDPEVCRDAQLAIYAGRPGQEMQYRAALGALSHDGRKSLAP